MITTHEGLLSSHAARYFKSSQSKFWCRRLTKLVWISATCHFLIPIMTRELKQDHIILSCVKTVQRNGLPHHGTQHFLSDNLAIDHRTVLRNGLPHGTQRFSSDNLAIYHSLQAHSE